MVLARLGNSSLSEHHESKPSEVEDRNLTNPALLERADRFAARIGQSQNGSKWTSTIDMRFSASRFSVNG
jgi:hypothetical protein